MKPPSSSPAKAKKKKSANAVDKPFAKHPPKAGKKTKPIVVTVTVDNPVIPAEDSVRSPDEIIAERVKIIDGVGLEIDTTTPLDEAGIIVDKFTSTEKIAGLMLGDAVAQLSAMHGESFVQFMTKTGRSLSYAKQQQTVVRAFPADLRHPQLSYSHYLPLTRLTTPEKKEAVKTIVKEHLDVRGAKKMAREKYPKPAKPVKIKPETAAKKKQIDYVMTPSEAAAFEAMRATAQLLAEVLDEPVDKDGKTWKQLITKLPAKARGELAAILKPIAKLWTACA